jgi:TPR repeat protein
VYSNPDYGVLDLEKARAWYQKAVDLKLPYAMMKLGVFLRKRALAEPAQAQELNIEAARFMRDGADAGNLIAMTNLGKFLLEGIGVRVDVNLAKAWLARAAALGFATAKFLLGTVLYDGKGGTPKDVDEATKLWREAAAAGDAQAIKILRDKAIPL